MGRPRKHNTDLPKRVYLRIGVYYLVTRGKWTRLGRSIEGVDVQSMLDGFKAEARNRELDELRRFLRTKLTVLKARPEARSGRLKSVDLDASAIIREAEICQWRCAVTGTPLSLKKVNGRMPFAPSIDRIDSAGDYTMDNVRVVCVAANLAMNVWGERPLREMAKWMVSKGELLNRSGGLLDKQPEDQALAR